MTKKTKKDKKAIDFYKEIEAEQDRYKLVNNGFIVKYLDEEFSYYIGEFLKGGSANNPRKTNLVDIKPRLDLKYSKKRNMRTTNLGFWKPLDIKFIEKPIREILN